MPLGGSGQTVGGWRSVEKNSRVKVVFLDADGVDIHTELGQSADVVVCMLGMNDVLYPATGNDAASIDGWASNYRSLIRAVRARVNPRVFALATPTLCTEDPQSPKNKTLRKFAEQLDVLAKEEKCVVLPTWETMKEVLDLGLTYRPDFHVTGDSVHPNSYGHVAVAVGILCGLGEPDAAKFLIDALVRELPSAPSLSYRVSHLSTSENKDLFNVAYHYRAPSPA